MNLFYFALGGATDNLVSPVDCCAIDPDTQDKPSMIETIYIVRHGRSPALILPCHSDYSY